MSEIVPFPSKGARWFASLSCDPQEPSTIVINERTELAAYDIDMIVVPGEILWVYRVAEGMVIAGFPGVTVH